MYLHTSINIVTSFPCLLQLINRIRQRLLVGLDRAPDIAVALMTGSLTGVVHTL